MKPTYEELESKLSHQSSELGKVIEAVALSNTVLRSIGDVYPDNDEGDFRNRRHQAAIKKNEEAILILKGMVTQ